MPRAELDQRGLGTARRRTRPRQSDVDSVPPRQAAAPARVGFQSTLVGVLVVPLHPRCLESRVKANRVSRSRAEGERGVGAARPPVHDPPSLRLGHASRKRMTRHASRTRVGTPEVAGVRVRQAPSTSYWVASAKKHVLPSSTSSNSRSPGRLTFLARRGWRIDKTGQVVRTFVKSRFRMNP
jgi:hypothetical protein